METHSTLTKIPHAVIGIPTFNNAKHLPEALESLLSQDYPDAAFILIDDQSTDQTPRIVRRYQKRDSRLVFHRNEIQLGYVENAMQCFRLSTQYFPDAEFFAWASDHDVWHPQWLTNLVRALQNHREAVLAFPKHIRIHDGGREENWNSYDFDTTRVKNRWKRLQLTIFESSPGNMIYGLFRRRALESTGGIRKVLGPDRLLLSELSLLGPFVQVDHFLWYRRYVGLKDRMKRRQRQRRNIFVGVAPPAYAYFPPWIPHVTAIFRDYVLKTRAFPILRRHHGVVATIAIAAFSVAWNVKRIAIRAVRNPMKLLRNLRNRLRRRLHRIRESREKNSSHGSAD